MSKIKITCDSTCDLTPQLYQENQVSVIPLCVTLGEEPRRDGVDITADELFHYVQAGGQLPKTSAISIGEYEDFFRNFTEDGYQVIHINLSGELSSSHQNACIAADSLEDVFVIDSRNLSTGSGHLVLLAQELARQGLSAQQIISRLEDARENLEVSFVLQTLEYLHKGGRCSGLTAYGANVLKLRPEIEVVDGKMQVGKKFRGQMEKSILSYVRSRLEGRQDLQLDRIFVTHSGVPEEIVQQVTGLIRELQPFREILVTRAGCTISSHCGPDCLGVLFFRKPL